MARVVGRAGVRAKVVKVDGRQPQVTRLVQRPRDGDELERRRRVRERRVRGRRVAAVSDGRGKGLALGRGGLKNVLRFLGLPRRVGGQQRVPGEEAVDLVLQAGPVADRVVRSVKVAREAVDLTVRDTDAVGQGELEERREIGPVGALQDQRVPEEGVFSRGEP